jgi:hypothetical protein
LLIEIFQVIEELFFPGDWVGTKKTEIINPKVLTKPTVLDMLNFIVLELITISSDKKGSIRLSPYIEVAEDRWHKILPVALKKQSSLNISEVFKESL